MVKQIKQFIHEKGIFTRLSFMVGLNAYVFSQDNCREKLQKKIV